MDAEGLVHRLFEAFARRDVDGMLAAVHEDFELWPQGTSELTGRTQPYVGHDGLREYVADVGERWESLRLEPGKLRVAAGGVVAFGTVHGTTSGLAMVRPVIWVLKVRGERLASCRAVATAAEAEGAVSC